jgi:hypothetical protein
VRDREMASYRLLSMTVVALCIVLPIICLLALIFFAKAE